MSHATPDVDLAEAQMALGRPDLLDETDAEDEAGADEPELDAPGEDGDDGPPPGGTVVAAERPTPAPAERPRAGKRLINFLQGSWRELQRVQWPDRRQVVQATGVVIGFVIVAGVYLGIADALATKLMNYILK